MPSESLPLTVLQEIDRVCDSFEAAWHAGLKPRIEEYLERTTLEYRTVFFSELLAREVELRRKAGERPEAGDYVPRFVTYGELILTVINRSMQSGLTVVLPLTLDGSRAGFTALRQRSHLDRTGLHFSPSDQMGSWSERPQGSDRRARSDRPIPGAPIAGSRELSGFPGLRRSKLD